MKRKRRIDITHNRKKGTFVTSFYYFDAMKACTQTYLRKKYTKKLFVPSNMILQVSKYLHHEKQKQQQSALKQDGYIVKTIV